MIISGKQLIEHEEGSITRESWLLRCADKLYDTILEPNGLGKNAQTGASLLEGLRVSVGWPSTRGLSTKKRVIGQCWNPSYSEDGTTEIFISPVLEEPSRVADVLLHELVHAAVGTEAKHGGRFASACKRVGLEGKPTATAAGPELAEVLAVHILPDLGEYPHKRLDMALIPKQSTRMLKASCPNDQCPTWYVAEKRSEGGFVVRVTHLWVDWLEAEGYPFRCPGCGTELEVEAKDSGQE